MIRRFRPMGTIVRAGTPVVYLPRFPVSYAMRFFCLLWIPLFYYFQRSLTPEKRSPPGSGLALILGSVTAAVHFFAGPLAPPEGFGLSRWIYSLVDVIAIPVALPLLVYGFLAAFKLLPGFTGMNSFALLWLIPAGIFRSVSGSIPNDPVFLVAVPLLWTALAEGIPFCIRLVARFGPIAIPALIVIPAQLFLAVSSFWAMYVHNAKEGMTMFIAAMVPLAISLVFSFYIILRNTLSRTA
ncbi:hypothetical protein FACS189493_6360 [Spirochaetia bacterium]|nr:hypothetical protein FACS189493_6360 [Spirochaetia bacterium]